MTSSTLARPATAVAARPRRGLPPEAALVVIGLGVLVVLGLWWNDTVTVEGLDGWLTNAGRLTGLLAGYVVVVVLALMSRVPALEHGIGTDRLARWHALGGRYLISLAVAHTLLIIWGYAVAARTGVVHETGTLLTGYPDVLMATVALLLLVAVGVASARAARRRLRYETWHFVHLYTYLAIALSFSHQFATGADFRDPTTRLAWAAMYVGVGGLLLWFRAVAPVVAFARHDLRVHEVRRESHDVVSVVISGRDVARLGAHAGQFFRWRFLTRSLWWAANPYSLSAAPTEEFLRITVRLGGTHSSALATLRPGTRVFAEGPYGAFTEARRRRWPVLLIGAGVGITPLRALLETIPGPVTLLYRARRPDDLVLRHELDALATDRGARVHYLLGRRGDPARDPLSAASLTRLVPDIARHDVFLCGPPALTRSVVRTLRRLGVPRRHIHHESFSFEEL